MLRPSLPEAQEFHADRFISSIKKSHDLTHNAIIVSVGFWQGFEVNPEASIT
jgi:hypothetical protein